MATKKQRDFLYKKTNGRCGYCGCTLPDRWHVDHMEPIYRDTYRLAKRFGLIQETPKPVVFYFETLVCGEGK